jgi:aryl-alcohol dehydrogenase-like predicted oxidoreductase
MKYTTLGRTGVTVSRICLGCMSYGDPQWRPWVLDDAQSQPFFKQAVELGINFFDTADMYSVGASEEVTGRALKKYARLEECVVATKVFNAMSDGKNTSGLSRKHIVQGCEASLKRLGMETIDLYQIHRVDPLTPLEEMLSALDHLVKQGKVRYIGASSTWAWKMAKCLGLSELHGWSKFVSMQNHYNLLYREEEREMMPFCASEGLAVLPWSPLARGLLAGRPASQTAATTRGQTDDFIEKFYGQPSDQGVIDAVQKVAAKRDAPPAQVSLAWMVSKPYVTAPIVGATKPHHLKDAAAALELTLTQDEVKELEAPYQPHAIRGHKD